MGLLKTVASGVSAASRTEFRCRRPLLFSDRDFAPYVEHLGLKAT